jgi:hypothetical protein
VHTLWEFSCSASAQLLGLVHAKVDVGMPHFTTASCRTYSRKVYPKDLPSTICFLSWRPKHLRSLTSMTEQG